MLKRLIWYVNTNVKRLLKKNMLWRNLYTLKKLGCNADGMIVVTKYSEPSGPFFYYDPPTNESYGAGPPNVRDPYERKWLDLVRLDCSGSQPTSNIKKPICAESYLIFTWH